MIPIGFVMIGFLVGVFIGIFNGAPASMCLLAGIVVGVFEAIVVYA